VSDIKLPEHCIGSKFRPVHWHDIRTTPAKLIGWGLEEKRPGARIYTPVGYLGEVHPFKTKAAAQQVCKALNAQSAAQAKAQGGIA
jgi:hypothetical protein